MAEGVKSNVELGFAEENLERKLTSKYFPSKIGGKPAWLDLKNIPKSEELKCPKCNDQCVFLLQIYAPNDEKTSCYHRTILIFVCKNNDCCEKNKWNNFLIFRSQLPRENEFYNYDPYINDEEDVKPNAVDYNALCHVCGCFGPLRCSKCKFRTYCCLKHQKIDWRNGHSKECKRIVRKDSNCIESSGWKEFLLPEYEIVMEEEPDLNKKCIKSDQDAFNEYKNFLKSHKATSIVEECKESNELLEELAKKEDKIFDKFIQRTRIEPHQVLRYEKGGKPLWISHENIPEDENIPNCICGAKRIFEFQVMPQLLNHLKLDHLNHSIDWGILAIYTCSVNCNEGTSYHPEFIWKQDI